MRAKKNFYPLTFASKHKAYEYLNSITADYKNGTLLNTILDTLRNHYFYATLRLRKHIKKPRFVTYHKLLHSQTQHSK